MRKLSMRIFTILLAGLIALPAVTNASYAGDNWRRHHHDNNGDNNDNRRRSGDTGWEQLQRERKREARQQQAEWDREQRDRERQQRQWDREQRDRERQQEQDYRWQPQRRHHNRNDGSDALAGAAVGLGLGLMFGALNNQGQLSPSYNTNQYPANNAKVLTASDVRAGEQAGCSWKLYNTGFACVDADDNVIYNKARQ